jgi:hypothetical protein
MTMDPDSTATTTDPVTSTEGSGSGTQQNSGMVTLASYKGLQTNYNKLKARYDQLEQEFHALSTDHEGLKLTVKGFESEKTTLQSAMKQKDEMEALLKAQLDALALEKTRSKLIMDKFIDLAPFEGKGLLPSGGTEEELEAKLNAFREALQNTVSSRVDDSFKGTTAGASTATTTNTPARTKEQVYSEMVSLAGSRDNKDRARYDALVREWDALID